MATSRTRLVTSAAAALVVLIPIAAKLPAQEDPFGGPRPPGAAAEARDVEKREAKGKAEAAKEEPQPLVIELVRQGNPTTPAELMRAAEIVLQYGRADECKRYLAKLVADMPTDEALAPLAARYPDLIIRLARERELQPEGKQAADRMQQAAQRVAQDADRISALITKLSSESPVERQEALRQLAASGAHAVGPMLRVLADAARQKEHRLVRAALAWLGKDSELPLIAAVATKNRDLKVQVIAVLGQMESKRAVGRLVRLAVDPNESAKVRDVAGAALQRILGAAPDQYEAERYLAGEVARLLRGELPDEPDHDNLLAVWTWDDAQLQATARKLPRADAAVMLAAEAARELYLLRSGDGEAQRLMLLLELEAAKSLGGLEEPIAVEGSSLARRVAAGLSLRLGDGAEAAQTLSGVLRDALRHGRVAAALGAIDVLAELGDASVLRTAGAAPAPLAEAMVHPDRRVRLAAALAVVKLAPGEPFPGAGRLAETLGWFAATSGGNHVLVGHPRGEEAQTLIGFMNALGYEGEAAYTGRALAERAFANPDSEFVLISDAIDSPPVEELVQWLRRDYRTARLPVGVMARGERLAELREAMASDAFTSVFPRIHSLEVAATETARLKAIAGRSLVGREERIRQARAALTALATLAADKETLVRYDLLRQEPAATRALYNPALTTEAARLLGLFGTPRAQTALVDFASQSALSLAERQAAAAAFAAAVKSRGLLLTRKQIEGQRQRTKASESLDAPTQEVLRTIWSAIEAGAVARRDSTSVHD